MHRPGNSARNRSLCGLNSAASVVLSPADIGQCGSLCLPRRRPWRVQKSWPVTELSSVVIIAPMNPEPSMLSALAIHPSAPGTRTAGIDGDRPADPTELDPPADVSLESTATLLALVREGDDAARTRLCALYLPILRKWARGRLPPQARDLAETDDMVQVTLIRALNRIDDFNPRHEGAFLAYLRRILLNNIRAEVRRVSRMPQRESSEDLNLPSEQLSLVEAIAGEQLMARYEEALTELTEAQREAVMLRVEFGFSYPEIASAMNISTANAARMTVCRGLEKLAERL